MTAARLQRSWNWMNRFSVYTTGLPDAVQRPRPAKRTHPSRRKAMRALSRMERTARRALQRKTSIPTSGIENTASNCASMSRLDLEIGISRTARRPCVRTTMMSALKRKRYGLPRLPPNLTLAILAIRIAPSLRARRKQKRMGV